VALMIAELTDQLLVNTLRAAEASSRGTDWLTLAQIERLEQQLMACIEPLGYHVSVERHAA
jgi:hypothetical protein